MITMTINVQQYGPHNGPTLVWPEPITSELTDDAAAKHRADLTRRRRSRNLVQIPGGIEFDTYAPGCAPLGCPELVGSRTRVTFSEGAGR